MSLILILSPEPWEAHFVSKHHYAMELARRGHDVLFHGPPERGAPMRIETLEDHDGKLKVLRAPPVTRGLRRMPGWLRRWLEARWLRKVERLVGRPVEVVWNFENSRFFDMRFAGNRLKIYHQVDLNQDFEPETAAATADLAIAVSGPINNRLKPHSANLARVGHSCPSHAGSSPKPDGIDEAFNTGVLHAVLTGNLDIPYLDIPLLTEIVTNNNAVRFHFIGSYIPGRALHAAINGKENVVFWGKQLSTALPAFLVRADLLMVAYLADEYLEQLANPHKMMEYLAAGKCILATRTLEYEDRPELVVTARDRASYVTRFSEIMANPTAWNTPKLIARRRAFAADNTYPRQLDRIVQALGPRGRLIS